MPIRFQLRQIIEQVFKIVMRSEEQFTPQQIVWAQASINPCWPATVISFSGQVSNSKTNQATNVEKFNFFRGINKYAALESSCHQQSNSLAIFGLELAPGNLEENELTFLKKSRSLTKAKDQSTQQQQQDDLCIAHSLFQVQKLGQRFNNKMVLQKEVLETVENTTFNKKIQNENKVQYSSIGEQIQEISDQNIMSITESDFFKQLKSSKGYTNRKQVLAIETRLKVSLLAKYRLTEIPKPVDNKKIVTIISKPKPKANLLKNRFCKNNENNSLIMASSAKKLCKIMKSEMGYNINEAKEWSHKIIQSLAQQYGNSCKLYCRKYLETISLLKLTKSVQEVADFVGCYQDAHMEESFYKKQDEQRSKLTQIQSETN